MQTPYQIILAKQRQKRNQIIGNQLRNISPLVRQTNPHALVPMEAIITQKIDIDRINYNQRKLLPNSYSKFQQSKGAQVPKNMSIQTHRMKIEQLLKKEQKNLTLTDFKTENQKSLDYYSQRCRPMTNASDLKGNIIQTYYSKKQSDGKSLQNRQHRRIVKGSNIRKNFSFQQTVNWRKNNSGEKIHIQPTDSKKVQEIRNLISQISTRNKTVERISNDIENNSGVTKGDLSVSLLQNDDQDKQQEIFMIPKLQQQKPQTQPIQKLPIRTVNAQALVLQSSFKSKQKNIYLVPQKKSKSLDNSSLKSDLQTDKTGFNNSILKSAALNQTVSYSSRFKIIHSSRQKQHSQARNKVVFKVKSSQSPSKYPYEITNKSAQKQKSYFIIPKGQKIQLSDFNEEYRVCLQDVGIYPQKDFINDQALTNFIKACKKKRIPITKYGNKLVESIKNSIKIRQTNKQSQNCQNQFFYMHEYDKYNRERNKKYSKDKSPRKLNDQQQKETLLEGWQNQDTLLENNQPDLFKQQDEEC